MLRRWMQMESERDQWSAATATANVDREAMCVQTIKASTTVSPPFSLHTSNQITLSDSTTCKPKNYPFAPLFTNAYMEWHHSTCLISVHLSRMYLVVNVFARLIVDSCRHLGIG